MANDPTIMPSSPTVLAIVDTTSPTVSAGSTGAPSYYPTCKFHWDVYLPSYTHLILPKIAAIYPKDFPTTSNSTYSPTFYQGSTTTTDSTLSGSGCMSDFCEHQLSDDYIMEYKLNVPEGVSVDDCQSCSVTIRLTYEGEAWLGFAFSTDGQMIGSEAVM
jgi:hypothetical protein